MADLPPVPNEGDLVTLADMSSMNVFAQLEIDNPELAEEIKLVISGEIRRVEIELSIMMMDMRKNFAEDIASLKAKGVLPEGHILNVLEEQAHAG
jgi:hypothetical protein